LQLYYIQDNNNDEFLFKKKHKTPQIRYFKVCYYLPQTLENHIKHETKVLFSNAYSTRDNQGEFNP